MEAVFRAEWRVLEFYYFQAGSFEVPIAQHTPKRKPKRKPKRPETPPSAISLSIKNVEPQCNRCFFAASLRAHRSEMTNSPDENEGCTICGRTLLGWSAPFWDAISWRCR